MSRNYMSRNDELRRGDSLVSNNGRWKAIFQDDGNFVIYDDGKATWASDTNGSDGFRLCLQGDCNLVLYSQNGGVVWTTDTYTSETNMCHLQLTDDGKLELSREANQLWSSAKNRGWKGY
ncbi:B-type lectin plumieribetin-like [Brachionichthys hirsutus]|uniref:B-type lectin plumieribetin-like n=1 Tax=Brachionichthys hirsutus TaxID=412623 RepID=UPI0036049303